MMKSESSMLGEMNQDTPMWKELGLGTLLIPVLFLFACAVLTLGLGVYLWIGEPQRLVISVDSQKMPTLVQPQPTGVFPGQTNLFILAPPPLMDPVLAGTFCRVWSRGIAFESVDRLKDGVDVQRT